MPFLGPRRTPQVTVVTRSGCHLCDELERQVREVAGPGVPITMLDLDEAGLDDPELLERYTTLVPVLIVDGVEVGHWRVDSQIIRKALRRGRRR